MYNDEEHNAPDTPTWSRVYVQWPESEPIPRNIEEALALGWQVDGDTSTCSNDELTREGRMDLSKKVGLIELYLEIPFQAMFTYGQPCAPMAVVEISTSPISRHKCQTLIAQ